MSRFYPSVSCVLTLAILMSSVFADTITLKSGEHVEGKITGETDKDVTVQVQVSAGITDERVIKKVDIEKMEKVSPEILAYQALTAVQLGPDSLGAAQYEPAIRALQAFVTQFPNSARTADVRTTLKGFQEEQKRVEGGEVKLDGQWLSKAEVEKGKVQIGGRRAFAYMKSQSAAGEYVGALNTFMAIEKNFPGAAVLPDAIDLAQQVINQLKPAVTRAQANYKAFLVERKVGIAGAGAAERVEMAAAVKAENAKADAIVEAATKANTWPPLMPNSEKSLTALQAMTDKEGTRLLALPVDKMRQSLKLTAEAKTSLDSGDAAAAADKIKEATGLWSANDLAKHLSNEVSAMQKATTATPVPVTPVPAAAKPTPAPATPKPKPSTPNPAAAAAAAAAQAAADKASSEDDKPFILTLPGIASAVVGLAAVLAGANIYLKKKKSRDEQVEII